MTSSKTNPILLLSYAGIFALWALSPHVMIPYTVHTCSLVLFILYSACHHSLNLREQAEKAKNNEPGAEAVEVMKKEDAMQFPIIGSCALFGLYLALKYLGKEWVNFFIGLYFCLAGTFAVSFSLAPFLKCTSIAPKLMNEKLVFKRTINITNKFVADYIFEDDKIELDFSATDILSLIVGVFSSWYYFTTRYWVANNVLAISFCLQGIERVSLGSFKIGAILLIGLFFYDIFWVFGTNVMVDVAKGIDGPIKILFPRSLDGNEDGKIALSLLGLGDIVIPGFFIALMLRFDAHNAKTPAIPTDLHVPFPKPYFHSCLFAYMLGLVLTMVVMIFFDHAQPALLYLVPACVGSTLMCAFFRGEMKLLFEYTEESEEVQENSEKKSVDDKKNE